MNRSDTIAAFSTPAGVGGIAVARISGPAALPIVLPHLSVQRLEVRKATYCRFDELDDVVAVYYAAPHSYTGEETVELSCHGSQYVQQALLQALVDSGARMAEAGEFTLRAFANGHLNLSQAEAVADLIEAVTPAQHRLAVSQLRGGYAQKLRELRQQLVDLTSLLELELDFSQEDVEFADRDKLRQLLATLHPTLSSLIGSFRLGNAVKRGIPVAIIGEPNVGKSTLLNALLDDDRAIVSNIPGTTRDTVEGMLTIGDTTFRLVDTAGLRETEDTVERLGIERSRRAYDEAMVVLHVEDATQPSKAKAIGNIADGKHHILVHNKCDIGSKPTMNDNGERAFAVSALTGEGIDQLKHALLEAVSTLVPDDILLTNARHYDALRKVDDALTRVGSALDDGIPADLVAVDLRDALYHLGTITGEVASDEVLGNIFSRFCVGK